MEFNKVLFVVTSHDQMGNTDRKTGIWIEEFAAPYYYFLDNGKEITIASPKGGQAPIDPKSNELENRTEATVRYFSDPETQKRLANTKKISEVNEKDFDTVFYPGGHGPMWDLPDNKDSINLLESFNRAGKVMTLMCHSPVALINVKDTNGELLIKGKRVTAFTNGEETTAQLDKIVPFLLEDKLRSKGANYQKGEDWAPFVTRDGKLITGQNPASSVLAAETVMEVFKRMAATMPAGAV
ncbi:glutamine amidotransferase [Niastella yeongjuensis]|uniref:Glutamine amidotransferase n=1 Tax=Niastella yeongjuensis TaxID=354355 RepID=A0A1V9EGT8_9BACT|nr:type 1 glutamine amidotransferase domain-containing protein [Niastella yeongjuensis]OQP45125.1 glutamine amidotransferase [Niastella yeongjuensis]SEP48684.1 Putative intracellular protease/amidase [Niastella yeongjuensis]